MASLADVRAAGYSVAIAYEGWTEDDGTIVADVYAISSPQAFDPAADPAAQRSGLLVYLPDEPEALASFLESRAP